MTNTYDTSNFLPCPFCGAKPEAMDWHAGPRARIFVDCPNGNYDDEHGGCSVGPQVVGSDMEDAAARWNRRAQVPGASVSHGGAHEHRHISGDQDGVTLRDYIAAKAMQGLLASWDSHSVEDFCELAEDAYSVADVMIAKRER